MTTNNYPVLTKAPRLIRDLRQYPDCTLPYIALAHASPSIVVTLIKAARQRAFTGKTFEQECASCFARAENRGKSIIGLSFIGCAGKELQQMHSISGCM